MWNDESERERRRVDTKGCKLKFDVTSDNFSLFFTERERERERELMQNAEGMRSILL